MALRVPVLTLVALAGCGQEYQLSQALSPAVVPSGASDPGAPPEVVSRPSHDPVAPEAGGAAPDTATRPRGPGNVGEARPEPEQIVLLGGGARTEVVDFLFVVDDSSSMKEILQQVFDGIDALTEEGVFPADARIGVMSTLPANERFPNRVHPAAPQKPFLRLEPGFGDLVSRDRIAAFREVAPEEVAARFELEGCDAWFAPGATNEAGVPCLTAHTQQMVFPVQVEAGLTAVGQRLAKGPLFRTGAAANVIVVSDTHDPGLPEGNPWFDLLVAQRPTGEQLAVTAARQQVTSSFRLHAVAPAEACGNEGWAAIGPVYYEAAAATGGLTLDVCTADPDAYVSLIRRIVTEGSVPTRPVVPLAEAGGVRSVLVDGVPTSFHLSRDRKAVILDEPMPASTSRVTIRYKGVPEAALTGPGGATPPRSGGAALGQATPSVRAAPPSVQAPSGSAPRR